MQQIRRRAWGVAIAWGALAAPALAQTALPAQAADPIPLQAFAALPAIQLPSMSPDGLHVATVQNVDGGSYVVVARNPQGGDGADGGNSGNSGNSSAQPGDARPRVVLRNDNEKYTISSLHWAGNDRLLIGARFATTERGARVTETRLIAVDSDGGNLKADLARELLGDGMFERRNHTPQYQDRIVGARRDEPDAVLMAFDAKTAAQPDVYRIDVRTGRSRVVERNPGSVRDWMADAQGDVRLGAGWRGTVRRIVVRPPAAPGQIAPWTVLASYDSAVPGEQRAKALLPLGFDADPRFLYALAPVDGRNALVRIDLQDPAFPREALLADARFDVRAQLLRDPASRRVVGVEYATDRSRTLFWDDAARQRQAAIDRALPRRTNRVVSSDFSGQQQVVLSIEGSRPPRYYRMDWSRNLLTVLGDTAPALADRALATVKHVTVRSRDGLALEGYLTLPAASAASAATQTASAAPAKPLPTVLLPHGGPASADTGLYDYWAQFLASRGWAVLQLNFRGSVGYGQDFIEAGKRRWGLEMQDDLSDGLQWMVAQGIADPARVCIVGGSYGGYAALMGAIKDPALYRCVASYAGVTDLRDMLSFSQRFMDYEIGAEAVIGTWWGDREKLRQTSPALRAAEIRVPVLLMHGETDVVVPVDQSRDMADAMRKAGRADTLRYVELPLADHWLSREQDRVRVLSELERFLSQNLQ